jgi:carboxyl-terminal processing protease
MLDRRMARTLLLAAPLVLAACADNRPPTVQSARLDPQVFAEAYEDIVEYHLTVTSPEALTDAGLGKLTTIDKSLSVVRDGHDLMLRRGSVVERFPAQASADPARWAETTDAVIERARAISPDIAATPPDRLTELVIDGALGTLDPFSHYARPSVAKERRARRYGFGGVGVIFDERSDRAVIRAVVPETPAAAAGIEAGDRLVSIDGIAISSLAPSEIDDHLRGDVGTSVTLMIERPGAPQQIALALKRAVIVVPTVSLDLRGDIAWLRISAFNQGTAHGVAALLQQAHQQAADGLRGIVLDMRGDPGGLLEQSIDVARLFLDGGMVVQTIGRHVDSGQSFDAPPNPQAEKLPVAVLVNGGTASAAEIVAAALQDSGRAVVIGTSSFGKGTVQNVLDLANDAELTVTWAQLVPPRGYHLHHHGVVPTLCTVGVEDTPDGIANLLARQPPPSPAGLDVPRERLDEPGWQALRGLCPADRATKAVDLDVALKLLDDPALYRRVIAELPGGGAHHSEARAGGF